MSTAELSIIDEVESAIRLGSAEKGLETARRVTDLFLSSAGSFDDEQIALFDDVLERLIGTIELRAIADMGARVALAEISAQLAPIAQAPPSVIRRLANNDEIRIAGPVLQEVRAPRRRRAGEDRLQQGRAASARGRRPLVAEGDRHRRAAGAPLSQRQPPARRQSRRARLRKADSPSSSGRPRAIPSSPSASASASTCRRTCAANCCARRAMPCAPACCRARRRICSRKSRARSRPSPSVSSARCRVSAISKAPSARLQGSRRPASSMRRRCSASPGSGAMRRPWRALAALSGSTVEVIRPLMQSLRDDGLLVPCKAAQLSWETTAAVLESRFATGAMKPADLARAQGTFRTDDGGECAADAAILAGAGVVASCPFSQGENGRAAVYTDEPRTITGRHRQRARRCRHDSPAIATGR